MIAAAKSKREIVTTRIVDAPRDRVFKAWTDPDQLARWWGPKGFQNTFHEFDLRPGGAWRFIMHAPDGIDYQSESLFVEIVKPERIVFDHITGPRFTLAASFEDLDGKTRVTFCQVFESAALRDKVAAFAVEANEQNLDRLEAEVARTG